MDFDDEMFRCGNYFDTKEEAERYASKFRDLLKKKINVMSTFKKHNFAQRAAHLCNLCADDEFRPVLNNILFDEGYAVVTNGHILLMVPIVEISNLEGYEIEKLNGKLINKAAFKSLLKFDKIVSIDEEGICAEMTRCNASYKVKINFAEKGRYPNYKSVLEVKEKPLSNKISFNSISLHEICETMGDNMPILKPNGTDTISLSFRDSMAKGLLMQCLIRDDSDN